MLAFAGTAYAQQNCPNGRCQLAQPVGQYPVLAAPQSPLTATPVGNPPGPDFEWKSLPGIGYGWVQVPADAPLPPIPGISGAPAPKFDGPNVVEGRNGKHGRLFYHTVRTHVYRGLVDKGTPPVRAKQLVEALSVESIDAYADHVGIKVSGGIGDGKLLQWLVDHKEQILALIKFIIGLLAIADSRTELLDVLAALVERYLWCEWAISLA